MALQKKNKLVFFFILTKKKQTLNFLTWHFLLCFLFLVLIRQKFGISDEKKQNMNNSKRENKTVRCYMLWESIPTVCLVRQTGEVGKKKKMFLFFFSGRKDELHDSEGLCRSKKKTTVFINAQELFPCPMNSPTRNQDSFFCVLFSVKKEKRS